MWWDWGQITLLDSVVFSLLSIGILYIIGFGSLRLICVLAKKKDPFVSFDFLQRATFRILFGFIFVVFFVVIFSFFSVSFSISTLLVTAIAIIGLVVKRVSFKLKLPTQLRYRHLALLIIVLAVLLVTVFLSSMLITGSYGSTNDDGADHTLMTRIVLDNPNVLITRSGQPYANFLIRYPLGTHVLSAFLVTLFSVSIQKIVVLLSAVFPALIALSFYSTVKCLFNSKVHAFLSLIISTFFTIGLSLAPISWGGLPVLLSLFLSISSMGLIFTFLLKQKMTSVNAFLMGLLFLAASRTYPIALLMITLWFLLILTVKLFGKLRETRTPSFSITSIFRKNDILCLISFLLPLLLALPYFYALVTNNLGTLQGNLVSIVSNWIEPVKTSINFDWLFDIPALSFFFSGFGALLSLAPFSLIPLFICFIPRVSQRIDSVFPVKNFRRSLLIIYVFTLLILAYLTLTLYLPIDFLIAFFDPARVLQFVFVPGTILTAAVLFSAIWVFYLGFKWLFHSDEKIYVKRFDRLSKNRILACMLLILLFLSGVVLVIPIVSEQQGVYNRARSAFSDYQTLKQDDVSLMKWISENIPPNNPILASSSGSGQFLAAVTQRQVISINSRLANYSDLMAILTSNSSDLHAVPLLLRYNVSYVYIGSTGTTYGAKLAYYRAFNSTQFLSTPYFSLAKEVGDAWLFQFNASAALAAYNSAGPLPEFVDQWHLPTYINILASDGGYTDPLAGIYYGSGRLAVYAFANEGYRLDYWMLNGSYLCGPENPVNVDYLNWLIQPVFTKNT
jgi:hypothetical protein